MGLRTKKYKVMKVVKWISKLIFLERALEVCQPYSKIVLALNTFPSHSPNTKTQ